MNDIRAEAPRPLRFPRWTLIGAIAMGAGAVALGLQPVPFDPVASLAVLIATASLAAAERLLAT